MGRSSSSSSSTSPTSASRARCADGPRTVSSSRAVTASSSAMSPTRNSDRRLRPRSAPTKRATKSRGGAGEQLRRRADLGDAAALLHDDDEVAHLDGLVDVMGHEQDRLGEVVLEARGARSGGGRGRSGRPPRTARPSAGSGVGGQRARDADALALATGELARVAVAIARRVEADEAPGAHRCARGAAPPASRAGAAPWRRCPRSSGAGTGRPAG